MRFLPAYFAVCLGISVVLPLSVAAQSPSPVLSPSTTTTRVASEPATQQARKERLQQQLQQVRDTKKRKTIETIQTKLTETNKKATTRMTQGLEKVTSVFARIKTQSALIDQTANTTLSLAIQNAEQAIVIAQQAITAQAAKEYTITITSETTVRNDVGLAVSTLRSDLKQTHTLAVTARQATSTAAKELAKLTQSRKESTPASGAAE